MATSLKFDVTVEELAEKVHNLGSDTLKVALTNTSPNAADTHFDTVVGPPAVIESTSNAAEIAAGNGYTAGGNTVTITGSSQSGGTYSLVGNDSVFTSTGAFAQFRYVFFYNATGGAAATRPLLGWWDKATAVDLADTETFTVDFGASILTLA